MFRASILSCIRNKVYAFIDKPVELFYEHFTIAVAFLIGIGAIVSSLLDHGMERETVLYFASTIAQSTSALFGLTVTGYIFLQNVLQERIREDSSTESGIGDFLLEYKNRLVKLGILAGVTIIFCIGQMLFLEEIILRCSKYQNLLNGNISVLFIVTLVIILQFVIAVIDPNTLSSFNDRGKEKIDEELSSGSKNDNANLKVNFAEFFSEYVEMENEIIAATEKQLKINNQYRKYADKRFTMPQRLNYLASKNPEISGLIKKIDKLRQYRNYLAHGTGGDKVYVSDDVLHEIRSTHDELKRALQMDDDSK